MRHATSFTTASGLGLLVLLISGCSQSQDAAYVRDDVYDRPDPRTVTAAIAEEEKSAPVAEQSDYYNPDEAQRYANPRGYYDMAYNDPYYYGYDRYGFGMSYGNQWGGSMWSSGYGYGNVWNDPFYGGYGGYGDCSGGYGWNNGYGNSWNNGYYGGYGCGYGNYWNNPYSYGGYNGYGYYGYNGGCYNCYQPIITCGGDGWGSGAVFSHRPSFGGGASSGGGATQPQVGQRMNARDQIGLIKPLPSNARQNTGRNSPTARPNYPVNEPRPRTAPIARPADRPPVMRPERERHELPTPVPRNDNGGGRTTSPDRNTGGGGGGNNGGNSGGGRSPR